MMETARRSVRRPDLFGLNYFLLKKKSESKEKKKVSVDGKKPGADTEVFKSMLGDLIRIGGKLLRGVRIDLLELDFTVASEDPYNTALLFGGGSAAAGIIISIIQNNFVLKKKKISVKADFEADKTLIHCKAELSVPIWRLIAISIMLAAAYISKRNESVNN
jgi:hypothetical protein